MHDLMQKLLSNFTAEKNEEFMGEILLAKKKKIEQGLRCRNEI